MSLSFPLRREMALSFPSHQEMAYCWGDPSALNPALHQESAVVVEAVALASDSEPVSFG